MATDLPLMLTSVPGPKSPMLRHGQAGNHLPHPSHALCDREWRAGTTHVSAYPAGMHDNGDHAQLSPRWSQGTKGVVEGGFGVPIEPETVPPPVVGAELAGHQDNFFLSAAGDGWQQRLGHPDRSVCIDGHHLSARYAP